MDMARPLIEPLLADRRVSGAGFLHVIILDAALTPERATFDEAVLLEEPFARERWDADYAAFARAKARLGWRHRCDLSRLQREQPQRVTASPVGTEAPAAGA